jgi:putative ubiquitin-RnfH superfamily antitoxin RatB of RatAB toxin-antitoxin module
MAESPTLIRIQLCYAKAERQLLLDLSVPSGTTILQAIEASDLIRQMPEIDVSVLRVGIYGKLKTLDTVVRDGDRIEIYRPLIADPKESRRRRAENRDRKTA